MISMRQLALAACTTLLAGAAWQSALACACCTNTGERTDFVIKLEPRHTHELGEILFGPQAQLFVGEAEPQDIKGITTPVEKYALQGVWKGDRFVFAFRDEKDRSGTLVLMQPKTISILQTDQRSQPESPRGPSLYKEWKLSSLARGTGIFAAGLSARQTLTLVLQGRGNNCTSANDFTHWMLVMWGPKAKYHFYGSLVKTN